jgi:MFS family permease
MALASGLISESSGAKHRPSRPMLYVGWRVVAALALCTFIVYGASLYAFIVISEPLAREFRWSAAQTGSLVSAMWVIAPLALFTAPLAERVGAWRLAAFGLVVQAVALAAVDLVSAFWQLYLLRIIMGVGKVSLMTAAPAIISRWFGRRFATAMSLVWAAMSAGGLVLSPLAERLTAAVGWKAAALVLAGLLMVTPILARFIASSADPPVENEEFPTRAVVAAVAEPASPSILTALRKMSVPIAMLILGCVICSGVFSIAVITLTPSLLEEAGISRSASVLLLGLTAGGSMVGSGSIGWIADRRGIITGAITVILSVTGTLLALTVLPTIPSIALGVVCALTAGYAIGSGEVLWIALTRRAVGPALFATAYGGYFFALQLGYVVGGGAAGWTLDHFHRVGAIAFLGLIFLAPGLCSLVLGRTRRDAIA